MVTTLKVSSVQSITQSLALTNGTSFVGIIERVCGSISS